MLGFIQKMKQFFIRLTNIFKFLFMCSSLSHLFDGEHFGIVWAYLLALSLVFSILVTLTSFFGIMILYLTNSKQENVNNSRRSDTN